MLAHSCNTRITAAAKKIKKEMLNMLHAAVARCAKLSAGASKYRGGTLGLTATGRAPAPTSRAPCSKMLLAGSSNLGSYYCLPGCVPPKPWLLYYSGPNGLE